MLLSGPNLWDQTRFQKISLSVFHILHRHALQSSNEFSVLIIESSVWDWKCVAYGLWFYIWVKIIQKLTNFILSAISVFYDMSQIGCNKKLWLYLFFRCGPYCGCLYFPLRMSKTEIHFPSIWIKCMLLCFS